MCINRYLSGKGLVTVSKNFNYFKTEVYDLVGEYRSW